MKKGILLALLMVTYHAYAGEQLTAENAVEPDSLQGVMQQLGQDYSALNQAILMEDFEAASASAHAIANHGTPSIAQKMKLMATLGTDMMAFKKVDAKVHELAVQIEESAKANDMKQLIQQQSRMLHACMQCHTVYRKRIIAR